MLATVVALGAPAPAQDATPTIVRVTSGIAARAVEAKGETFFDETFSIRVAGSPVVMSNNSDGTGAFTVDDLMTVTVTRPDGQRRSFSHNFSNGCTKLSRSGPFDVTDLTAEGVNQVRVQMRDVCGVKVGSSRIWLHNVDPQPTPSPSSSTEESSSSPSPPSSTPPSVEPSTSAEPSPSPSVSAEPSPSSSPSAAPPSPDPPPDVLGVTHHRSPDLKWVAYIASRARDLPRCVGNFVAGLGMKPVKAAVLCAGFHVTSNPRPPASFTRKSWSRFRGAKEYRSLLHIPRIDYECRDGRISWYERPGLVHHEGYTPGFRVKYFWWRSPKIQTATWFVGSERYEGPRGLPFNARRPKFYISGDRRALTVSYLQASRLSKIFRVLNYFGVGRRKWLRTGYDAPFIWTYVRERLTCTGAGVKIVSSSVPTRVLYLNNRRNTERPQARDVAAFIREGGRWLHRVGQGRLDRRCQKVVRTFWGRASFPPRKGCLSEIRGW